MSYLSGIYRIVNKINGKCYVGSSVNVKKRFRYHSDDLKNGEHHSKKLQRAVNKYGLENFDFLILEECLNEVLIVREQYWIDFYDSCNKGYNSSPKASNCLGMKHDEIARKNMSLAHKGKARSKDSIEKFKATMKVKGIWNKGLKGFRAGRKLSEETKKKISEGNKGKRATFLGKHHSDESKLKISRANSGTKNGMYGKDSWNRGINHPVARERMLTDANPMKGIDPSKHPMSKLDWDKVDKIRELYSNGDYNGMEIAKIFSINHNTVYNIIKNKFWKKNQ